MSFKDFCTKLEDKIISSYENGVTADTAEKLASEFLGAQMKVSQELTKTDLDARMKKSGLKAVRATAYMSAATSGDKKPTEAAIAATIDTNELVSVEQDKLDRAEVTRDELERYYNIFQNAHVHYRNVAKGAFGG